MLNTNPLLTHVVFTSDEVVAELRDRRAEALGLFGELDESQREQLAFNAWSIGLRALHNAHTAAQESKLKDIGASLLSDIDRQLRAHLAQQQTTIGATLARFFDPSDGQVTQRLAAFMGDQGVLARLLEKYVGGQNSALATELARQVGQTSPLFKMLSPTESEGLVRTLAEQLGAVMNESHSELMRALDPLAEGGAVARFLTSLRDELKGADADRQKQLALALAALDANDDRSLLSRMMREAQQARLDVLSAVNPDAPESPMAILRSSLTALLQQHASAQTDVARRQEARQTAFEKEVREALARIETRRAADQRSPKGGLAFEDAVAALVRDTTTGAPCVLEATGATAGLGRCKKGDAVLRFTDDSAYAGASVVFEMKRDSSYTVQMALDELDSARKNRGASVGVFVMARSHASDLFPRFARYGTNVLVTWDEGDPATNPWLESAVWLGMALVARAKAVGDPGDLAAMRDVEARIESEVTRLEKMEKHCGSIRSHAEGITEEVRKGKDALERLLRKARSTLAALKVELTDEVAERAAPIACSKERAGDAAA